MTIRLKIDLENKQKKTKILTDTRIMINHAEYSIASTFHMIIGTYTAKHWR